MRELMKEIKETHRRVVERNRTTRRRVRMSMHHKRPIRWRLLLVAALVLVAAAIGSVEAPIAAAGPTYDRWPGNLALQYANPDGSRSGDLFPVLAAAIGQVPSSLGTSFDNSLAQRGPGICDW